ncbi:probable alpha-ketoglutarate-dependent hypophosphite dioxygenase [Dreissena polymorpha]|uniref:probable alpha-ketoglutarate-dependent hypophosphite dioxygenase n=1 Tax=Dreissena polymorpha TaxID=45954 RepID=UPI0022646305|nr:probable alpha-ketoglutarate-dependent hypophosphite dioxygenase [Dreissena polymorpha]
MSGIYYPDTFTIVPPQSGFKKPGQLPPEQIQQYFDEGYTVVRDFFTPEELQPCRDAIADMVDQLAKKLHEAGKITNLHDDAGLFQRLTKIEEEFPGANILLFKHQKIPKAFRDLWCSERLLNLIEQLIGPDIAGHPVWNMRTKTPNSIALDVPWHQDCGYFSEESYNHLIPTAWVPFLDTDETNGCLQMARYGHRLGKVAAHTCCHSDTWFIDLAEEEMEKTLGVDIKNDLVTVPVPYGGFLLFNNMIPHRSLPNRSNDVRWSIDLRWQSPHENYGFYGIAEGILFRSSEQERVEPDWEKFLAVDRKEVWQKKYFKQVIETDQFDTTVTGPWIGRWHVTNENKHSQAFTKSVN